MERIDELTVADAIRPCGKIGMDPRRVDFLNTEHSEQLFPLCRLQSITDSYTIYVYHFNLGRSFCNYVAHPQGCCRSRCSVR